MASPGRLTRKHTTETPAKDEGAIPYRHPLDTGDKGALVLWAQSRMAEQGFYDGPLDGRYDLEVSKAVRKLQQAHSLYVNGIIDRKTWAVL